jgi:hypothetical protein
LGVALSRKLDDFADVLRAAVDQFARRIGRNAQYNEIPKQLNQ